MNNRTIYQQWSLILLIVIASFFWKIYLFPQSNIWVGDIGRDILAGHLILKEKLLITEGHSNSGIGGHYPSINYYFVALLTHLANDQYPAIANLLILYQSLGVFLLFLIIKNSFSYLPAIVTSFFYAFSFSGVNFSLFPISAHNSIPIFLFSIFCLQLWIKKDNLFYLILSGFLLVLASTFFYGAVLFFPLYLGLIAIKTIKKKQFFKSLLPSFIFIISCFVFLSIFFLKRINDEHAYYGLIDSGLHDLQITIDNLQFGQQTIRDMIIKLYKQVLRLHPRIPFFACLTYVASIVIAFKNKKTRKHALLFLSIFLIHILLYLLRENSLEHYLIYIDLLLIYVWGFILQQALNRKKIAFIILSSILLYSGDLLHNYNHINSCSYQHYQKANQIITKKYPEASIINWQNCNDENYGKRRWNFGDEPWESRVFWYFQKNNPSTFELSNKSSQIDLLNKNVVFVCFIYQWESIKNTNLNLKEMTERGLVFNFALDDKLYSVYSYEK